MLNEIFIITENIFRFSRKGKEYPFNMRIKWSSKNTFLGYIIRCLISDRNNPPIGFNLVKNYFESDCGKDINLTTASQISVDDFETK